MEIRTTQHLKDALRNGEFAWPGGYQMYFICEDGEALSFAAARANLRLCLHAKAYPQYRERQWAIIAVEINWEDAELTCADTGERIPPAYGSEE